jgi:hypothetical protein
MNEAGSGIGRLSLCEPHGRVAIVKSASARYEIAQWRRLRKIVSGAREFHHCAALPRRATMSDYPDLHPQER